MKPKTVTDVEMAFPAEIKHLMPPNLAEVRDKQQYDTQWLKFAAQWFYSGIDAKALVAKPGIDKVEALRHLKCLMGSYQPKHEDKMAVVAHLLGEWFESSPEAKK